MIADRDRMIEESQVVTVQRAESARPFSMAPRLASLVGLLALFWALFSRSLAALLHLAWQTDEYTHVFLVIPVSLSLIFLEKRYAPAKAEPSPVAAAGALVIAGAIGLWTSMPSVSLGEDARLALNIFALVLCCLVSVLATYGVPMVRALAFPLLFLFLIVPLPSDWLERAVVILQTASAEATFALFKIFGVPVIKHGFVLSLPSLNIEVAKQCSGIRSSIILLVTCLVLSHLFLRSTWSKVLFLLLVVPMAIAKNAIRIFTLSLLGIYVNRDFLEGPLHHDGGIVFFSLALATLFVLIRVLQFVERRTSPRMA